MTEYGFLERTGEESVGDILLRKHDDTIFVWLPAAAGAGRILGRALRQRDAS